MSERKYSIPLTERQTAVVSIALAFAALERQIRPSEAWDIINKIADSMAIAERDKLNGEE